MSEFEGPSDRKGDAPARLSLPIRPRVAGGNSEARPLGIPATWDAGPSPDSGFRSRGALCGADADEIREIG